MFCGMGQKDLLNENSWINTLRICFQFKDFCQGCDELIRIIGLLQPFYYDVGTKSKWRKYR